jgi:hypothetical protein
MLSGNRLQPVVLDDPAADITLARSGFAREQGRSVMDVGDPRAERRILHLGQLVDQEQQLAVRDTRQQAQPIVIRRAKSRALSTSIDALSAA